MEEKIQSLVIAFIRKLKGDKTVEHKKPGSGISSSKSNIPHAMRGCIPKTTNFLAIRNCNCATNEDSPGGLTIPKTSAPPKALQQISPPQAIPNADKRSSGQTRRNTNYYRFQKTSPDSLITGPPKRQHRTGDVENFHFSNNSVIETVQTTAEQAPKETNILPVIGEVFPSDPRERYPAHYRFPTPEYDMISMTVYKAELNTNSK